MSEFRKGPQLGPQTRRAREIYSFSPHAVPLELVRAGLHVKLACASANRRQGYLDEEQFQLIAGAVEWLSALPDSELRPWFPLDAFQGGAGTGINMNLNEAIALVAAGRGENHGSSLSALDHVNLHQSTNDVMPTALRLMLLNVFEPLEGDVELLQTACQKKEEQYAEVLKLARTQLRDATVMTAGQQYAGWAGALGRDRWRIFKARERLKEVNLGGTAVGSGLGAPREYALTVVRELQRLSAHPITRADNPLEATSNYDQVLEAMETVNLCAANLRKIASDARLLCSGPHGGFGELEPPAQVKGSSIMPGKVNPVLAEGAVQASERIAANHSLLTRLCSGGELELNAFLPAIAFTAWESLMMLRGSLDALRRFVDESFVNDAACARNLEQSYARIVALVPLFGYAACERIVDRARQLGHKLETYLQAELGFAEEDIDALLSTRNLTRFGYDSELYRQMATKYRHIADAHAGVTKGG
jgi:aspartate ammonia-lyase